MPPSAVRNPAVPKAALATPRPTLLRTNSATSPAASPTRHELQAICPRSWTAVAAGRCARGGRTAAERPEGRRDLALDIAVSIGSVRLPPVAAIRRLQRLRGPG